MLIIISHILAYIFELMKKIVIKTWISGFPETSCWSLITYKCIWK